MSYLQYYACHQMSFLILTSCELGTTVNNIASLYMLNISIQRIKNLIFVIFSTLIKSVLYKNHVQYNVL